MDAHFPEFEELEDALEAAGGAGHVQLSASELPAVALGEALVLANRKRFDLLTDGDERIGLLKAAVNATQLMQLVPGFGVLYVRDGSLKTEEMCSDFAIALGSELARVGLPSGPRNLVEGAVSELATNIQQHAGERPRGYVLYELEGTAVSVCVFDAGRGVVEGYTSVSPELKGLTAGNALVMAVREHRSRLAPIEEGRGNGFGTVLRAMKSLDARLRVRSGDAILETGSGAGAEWVLREQVELGGFVVSLVLEW